MGRPDVFEKGLDQDRGGTRMLRLRRIFGIVERRDFRGAGVFHPGHTRDFDRAVAPQFAAQPDREIGKIHTFRVVAKRSRSQNVILNMRGLAPVLHYPSNMPLKSTRKAQKPEVISLDVILHLRDRRPLLDEIATLVQGLTYGEMIELSEAMWKFRAEGSGVTQENLPELLHRWSKSRSVTAHDASKEIPREEKV